MPPDQAAPRYLTEPNPVESIRNKIEQAKKLIYLNASYSSRAAVCRHVADQLSLNGFQYPRITRRERNSKWNFHCKLIDALSGEGKIVIEGAGPERLQKTQPNAKRPDLASSTTVTTTLRPAASLSPTFLRCSGCRVPRAIKRFVAESGLCRYCHVGGSNKLLEEKFCIEGAHEEARSDFIDSNGEEYDACLHCRPTNGQEHANTKDLHDLDSSTGGLEWIELAPSFEPPRKKQKSEVSTTPNSGVTRVSDEQRSTGSVERADEAMSSPVSIKDSQTIGSSSKTSIAAKTKRDSESPEFEGDEPDCKEQIAIDETSDDGALEAIEDDAECDVLDGIPRLLVGSKTMRRMRGGIT